jgi:membrane-associated phospholipid phosphatase
MLAPSFNSFYLLILVLLTNTLNGVLKYAVMEPLYRRLKVKELPILGIGGRPQGAISCQFDIDNKKAKSFGMPSGHSQIIWTVGTYLICFLIKRFVFNVSQNEDKTSTSTILENIWMFVSSGIIISTMIFISYSRVYIEGCHTIQQVVVGGFIGTVLGFLAFYFEDDIRKAILGNSEEK